MKMKTLVGAVKRDLSKGKDARMMKKTMKVECAQGVKAPKLKLVESTYPVEEEVGVVDGEGAGRLANDISAFTGKISPFRVGLHIDETFALLRLLGCLVGAFCFLHPFDEAVFGKKFARRILCRNCETFGALGFV